MICRAGMGTLLLGLVTSSPVGGQATIDVRGKLAIVEKGGKRGRDLADAVVWLAGPSAPRPGSVDIVTQRKQFTPAAVVVGTGSTVAFPNHDPFNHNVFSVSEETSFDLGLYGRGETRSVKFPKPGVIHVYCNIHAQMGAVVVVVDAPWHARPAADGSFVISGVPVGDYTIHTWHPRGGRSQTRITVRVGAPELDLSLDASGFKPKPHLNKFGKPYPNEGRRY
jgi:plastocyanin